MEGLEAVLEAPELESGEQQEQQPDPRVEEKSYRDFVKGLKDDDAANPHYKRIKGDYGRLQEIGRLDKRGVEGVRETYEALKGFAHGDKQGIEAAREMQAVLSDTQAVLDAIADGDVAGLSEEQQAGVLRMVPSMLDRMAETDSDGYTKAMLPHFMDALKSSDLVGAFNSLVGVLQQKPPAYLTKEQIGSWQAEKFNGVIAEATRMGEWFKAQEDRLKEIGGKPKDGRNLERGAKPEGDQPQAGEPAAGNEWWKTNVHAEINEHVESAFTKELRPWADKLAKAGFRLSDAKKTALAQEFVSGTTKAMRADKDYVTQMGRFNKQKSPDAAGVKATAKTAFNGVASRVLKDLIERDYGQVLAGKTTTKKIDTKPADGRATPAPKGVRTVTVMPERSRIDFPRTPQEWLYENKYRLRDGSVVQYRP